ncbi:MAG: GNAT family N-acetyltransferase [Flavobacterium sp.]|nr:GNAT family N-acetyltransferase [Flavobacterium sp.]
MTISVASKEQLPIVRDLAQQIWPATYEHILSKDQFDYMMEMMYSLPSLEKQLQHPKPFLLVEDDGQFIGFASYELHFENSNQTKIHKLYVLPQIQGKGIGKWVINHIQEIALKAGDSALILTVNRFNKAKDFYQKLGFHIAEEKQFDIGNGYIMDDYVMKLPI